ncbi:NusA antitermination factor [Lachnospiraceae bacterium RM5]|nr:NusA antitermination factor [Lachnospiraceae bacterium RM5]
MNKTNNELLAALSILEKEKDINKEVIFEAIENSLIQAYKNNYGKADNVVAKVDRETGEFKIIAQKEVVESKEAIEDQATQIALEDAKAINPDVIVGETVSVNVDSKKFGRIATQNAKGVIVQKIREEERKVVYNQYHAKENDIVTGVVQRIGDKNISINLGKADAVLPKNEQVKSEVFMPTERIKLYVTKVEDVNKGPNIVVSRVRPEFVKRLFEAEVTEIRDGIVEIVSIAREAGVRSKIAVKSNSENVDPLGACVGVNGARVNAIVNELKGEKIDIVPYNENAAIFVENALSPAKVVSILADDEERKAEVVVPDYQLSLAIGKEGLNAKLAAKLTGFRIDIKSESQMRELEENDGEFDDEYDENSYDDSEQTSDEEFDFDDEENIDE